MKTTTHVVMEKEDLEAILSALVEKRTGKKVIDIKPELHQTKDGISLKAYHFECDSYDGK